LVNGLLKLKQSVYNKYKRLFSNYNNLGYKQL
jgi:hypothetical protein